MAEITPTRVSINKARDLVERVGWTFIQSFAGFLIAFNITDLNGIDWGDLFKGAAVASGIAALKVIIAQNVGDTPSGELLPGAPVIEPIPNPTPPPPPPIDVPST